ncbi:MAG: hypothetical protein ACYDD1_06845 [Caulobacteraceae bacterium]
MKARNVLNEAAPGLYEALAKLLSEYVEVTWSEDAGYWDPGEEDHVIAARLALRTANPTEEGAVS